jgi:NADH-quinone oxidoreductase subunit H
MQLFSNLREALQQIPLFNDALALIYAWIQTSLGTLLQSFLPEYWARSILWLVMAAISLVCLIALLGIFAIVYIYFERRGVARIQDRWGPNRAGPWGVLQGIADVVKLLTKEDVIPTRADSWVFRLAPIAVMVPAVMVFAIIPFGFGANSPFILADLNIGILYGISVGSLTTVGVLMAGWGSNNKYSLLAGLRSGAMMISYEIPLALALLSAGLLAGSLSTVDIVKAQPAIADVIPFSGYILLQPIGFLLFMIAAVVELNRCPFDFAGAESELVAGYHTEYSGMRFAAFYVAEYFNAFFVCCMASTLFLGGWRGPILPSVVWILIKAVVLFLCLVWLLGTLPRPRIDQMLGFAWKALIPIALVNLFGTALGISLWQTFMVR